MILGISQDKEHEAASKCCLPLVYIFQIIKHSELTSQTITPSPCTRNANRTGTSSNRTSSSPGFRKIWPSVSCKPHGPDRPQSVRELARRTQRGLNKEGTPTAEELESRDTALRSSVRLRRGMDTHQPLPTPAPRESASANPMRRN